MANLDSILIAANIPEFKNQGVLWFKENESKIKNQALKNLWWRNHTELVEIGLKINPLELMRRLADMGYVKNHPVLNPAEFSFLGSRFAIWPINAESPLALDFNGNYIESAEVLPAPKLKANPEKFELELFSRYKPGDYVVHMDHGIGKLKGTTPDLNNYFEIEYAGGDKLFLPFEQVKKISLYVGFTRPKIYRLGGNLWHKVKTKAKENVIKLAQDLLKLYAHRETVDGFAFKEETGELANLIADFE